VSGKPYTEFIKEEILKPLGMNKSFFNQEEAEGDPQFATPYVTTEEGEKVPSKPL
jgi:CubicO group peptidase (beta-lactamase class C family)